MIHDLLKVLSGSDKETLKEDLTTQEQTELIGNCFGFISPVGGTGVSTLIFELGKYLSIHYRKRVCIVEASNISSTLYNKYTTKKSKEYEYTEDSISIKKEKSIADFLLTFDSSQDITYESSIENLSEVMLEIDKNFYITTFASDDIKSTFNIDYVKYIRFLEMLKNYFDIVLIDIPWSPSFEGCIGSVESASTIYTVLNDSTDLLPYYRMKRFFNLTGSSVKFNNLILTKVSDQTFINHFIEQVKNVNLISIVPFLFSLEENKNKDDLTSNLTPKDKKTFNSVLEEISNSIFSGTIKKEGE